LRGGTYLVSIHILELSNGAKLDVGLRVSS
jgi:hypothetical protein